MVLESSSRGKLNCTDFLSNFCRFYEYIVLSLET